MAELAAGASAGKSSASAFLQAASAGDVEGTRRGLQSRDWRRLVAALDNKQRGCAHIAAIAGHAEVLRLLNDHGFEMEAGDRVGRTPLHLACENGKAAAVACLLECSARPGLQDSTGRTALHLAVCCQNPQICQNLVSKFPQLVFRSDRHGRTPIFYSCLGLHASASGETSRLLQEQLADVNQRDNYGRAPLHYGAEEGRLDAVQLLLRLRADPRAEDLEGQTPLNLTSHGTVQNMLRKALGLPHSSGAEAPATSTAAGRPHPAAASSQSIPPGAPSGPSKSAHSAAVPHAGEARPQSAGATREPTAAAVPRPLPPLGRPVQAVTGSDALGSHFQQLQSRFVQIMERVQQGGLDQMEHIKRPHVFTGSWMMDVSSHQQLLGQALRYVPGPEVCLRVFNLLRPPRSFPCARGDERAIMSYYSDGTAAPPAWAAGGVDDPYLTGGENIEDGGISHGRREELLKAIRDQRQQLDAKDAANEELRQKLERFQAELALGLDPEEAKLLRARLANANAKLTEQVAEMEDAKSQARVFEGEKAVLVRQLQEEKTNNTQLIDEHCALRQKLQAQYQFRGEEKSWQECFQQEAEKYEVLRKKLEAQVQQAWERTNAAEHREEKALAEMQQLKQLAQAGHELPGVKEQMERTRSELQASRQKEERLRGELDALRFEFERCKAELQEAKPKAVLLPEEQQKVQQLSARLSEAEKLAAQAPLLEKQLETQLAAAKQEMEDRLRTKDQEMDRETKKWMSAWSNYPLIGQMLFGGAPLAESQPQHAAGATLQSAEDPPQATTGPITPSAESVPQPAVVEQLSQSVAGADAANFGSTLRPASAGACSGTEGLAQPAAAAASAAAAAAAAAAAVLPAAEAAGTGVEAWRREMEMASEVLSGALAIPSKAAEDTSKAAEALAGHCKATEATSTAAHALSVHARGGEEVEDDRKLRMLAGGDSQGARDLARGLFQEGMRSGHLEDAIKHAVGTQGVAQEAAHEQAADMGGCRGLARDIMTEGVLTGNLEEALKNVLENPGGSQDPDRPHQAASEVPEAQAAPPKGTSTSQGGEVQEPPAKPKVADAGMAAAMLAGGAAAGMAGIVAAEAVKAGSSQLPGPPAKVPGPPPKPEAVATEMPGIDADAGAEAGSSKISGPPAKDQGPPAKPGAAATEADAAAKAGSSKVPGPPAKVPGPPAKVPGPPAKVPGPPTKVQGPPAKDPGPPAKVPGPPAQIPGPPPPKTGSSKAAPPPPP